MILRLFASLLLLCLAPPALATGGEVRIKELGRFLGWRDNALVGYGIVTGLAGSGDSPRSGATRQALSNVLSRLGATILPDQVQSRNVAVVIVTATLPADSNIGDRLDATVTSIGDARSLVGGTLLMTPLLGPDQKPYALAQGALVVGGYNFEDSLNLRQKNYPTSGTLPGGATVETAVESGVGGPDRRLTFVLRDPDFTTANRVAAGINGAFGTGIASVRSADKVVIDGNLAGLDTVSLISRIEGLNVQPDEIARIVINERSGTVVAGGPVQISSVVIAQGDIKVSVSVDNQASQPYIFGGYAPGARSLVVTNTKLDVTESARNDAVVRFPSTTVADLVQALHRAHVGTRSTIAILQAIKAAGALHAEIIVQ
ncbi:flagellar basal body P-ring protein FlgI [Flavisphingomonas formosensis]|uniref:flagellar basal body P-ring protein FlgI n=1 Tax=Flavisphingomonas formosensis TaxID=861534 RepID=UPI0012F71E1D|nr:flagellar basal body P-ring protein FlgI [Sphingomonas formosensis]